MSIDGTAEDVVDQVWFQKNILVLNFDGKQTQAFPQCLFQMLGVVVGSENGDLRTSPAPDIMVPGHKRWKRYGSAYSYGCSSEDQISSTDGHVVTPRAQRVRVWSTARRVTASDALSSI